jgi:thioester reductase-like protein
MSKIFLTGFPGFLGSELLPRILSPATNQTALCLVQEKFLGDAERRIEALVSEHPHLENRIELKTGDITQPNLGLGKSKKLQKSIAEIFHLAAVYDLSVERSLAMRVNVEGTRHMLDFAAGCTALQRFQYVSTCYVSGRYAGIFREQDLVKGQKFNNYYEETKYLAEVEVQKRMIGGLPATIYRPAIVVGDSRTGATQKYDGPYYVMRWLLRQPFVAVLPVVGDPTTVRVNLVPSDFVVKAIAELSGLETSLGKVYQLADSNPLTVDELISELGRSTGRLIVRVPALWEASKLAIDHLPGVYRLMQIPSSAIDYFVHPTHYTCENTLADLDGTGVELPSFLGYLDRLVEFVKRGRGGLGLGTADIPWPKKVATEERGEVFEETR